ncbi:hypothetical protein JOB18_031815 [Solea senegalensis]|uniref:Uncharacterized protein n=1 Tax=Solea senegalensis TaxID=28829 RepID=A0AAV6T8F5_SOLSE|nr:hypothetical protein JOB18_031815 [Solea senegalensis]
MLRRRLRNTLSPIGSRLIINSRCQETGEFAQWHSPKPERHMALFPPEEVTEKDALVTACSSAAGGTDGLYMKREEMILGRELSAEVVPHVNGGDVLFGDRRVPILAELCVEMNVRTAPDSAVYSGKHANSGRMNHFHSMVWRREACVSGAAGGRKTEFLLPLPSPKPGFNESLLSISRTETRIDRSRHKPRSYESETGNIMADGGEWERSMTQHTDDTQTGNKHRREKLAEGVKASYDISYIPIASGPALARESRNTSSATKAASSSDGVYSVVSSSHNTDVHSEAA